MSERDIEGIYADAEALESKFEQAIREAAPQMDIDAEGATVWEQGTEAVAAVDQARQRFEGFLQAHQNVLSADPYWQAYFDPETPQVEVDAPEFGR